MYFVVAKLPARAAIHGGQRWMRHLFDVLRRHVGQAAMACGMVCIPLTVAALPPAAQADLTAAAADTKVSPANSAVRSPLRSPGLPGWGPHGKPLYYFMVFSNPTPGADAEFNRWYDRLHAPVMIESGDFVWAQRFQLSPVQLAGGPLIERQYLVIFAIETDDIVKTAADATRRVGLPRNVRSQALDYSNLVSVTMEALGPPITQKEAQARMAEEEALGHVPPADAPKSR